MPDQYPSKESKNIIKKFTFLLNCINFYLSYVFYITKGKEKSMQGE